MGRTAELTPAPPWSFACPDWAARLKAGRSLLPDLPLDPERSRKAVGIFDKLRLPDVPGQPRMADAAGEWSRDIVRAVFGSLGDDGVRRVPEVFGLVPKKNSKTTTGAGVMLTALLLNQRPNAEFILAGPTQEVADLAFSQASGMIEADDERYLQKRFLVQEHRKTIVDRLNKSKLKIKTFDMKVMTGAKPAGVLLDELHLMSAMAFAPRVIGQIRGGMIANPEAFFIIITTQSDEPPAGAFKAELQYARGVRDGRIASSVRMLPMLYEFPEAMQIDPARPWADPANWPMVLPNAGRSITIERLVPDFETAREKGEDELKRWASQHLNVEIGLALHSDAWAGARYWEAAADPELVSLDALMARSEVCTIGIDGGGLDDLLGLAVIGREKRTQRWLLWTHVWAQPDVYKQRKEIVSRLEDFEREGSLTRVPADDPTRDVRDVAEIVARVKAAGLLPEKHAVGLDPVGVAQIVDALAAQGVSGDELAAIYQGYKLSGAVWGTERKLKDGTFLHGGSALMAWCVGNAKAEMKGNAVLITKQAAGKAKIDPLVATFDAVQLMARNPEAVRAAEPSIVLL